jgi:prepilin-type N-terminal cleavage/methylation domain-containing protein
VTLRSVPTERGLTLLEILVVLAIFGLLAGALTVGYKRLPGTALRRDATKIAAAMRTAYDRATASGAHHRVVLDLEESTFHVERCEGKVTLRKVRDLREEVERQRAEAEKQARLAGSQSQDELLNDMVKDAGERLGGSGGGAAATCQPVSGAFGRKQALGGSPKVSIRRVHVAHLEEAVVEGQATLNFFPLGTAERAVVELGVGEAEDEQFSVAVRPLSGRIDMQPGEWRDVEEAIREDAEGREQ